jgi:hypothetical protein
MNAAAKKSEPQSAAGYVSSLLPLGGGVGRRILLAMVLLVALIGGAYYAWQRWGAQITVAGDYILQADDVQVNPPPDWITTDLCAEVVRDGGLIGLSMLDPQLTVKVAQAFSMSSWVEAVKRVSKTRGAGVRVEVTYRKPVAMVEVRLNGKVGVLPVDSSGVLLPTQDFTSEKTGEYLQIAVPHANPVGTIGSAWGQNEVHEAAAIAAVLDDRWQECGLYRIRLVPAATAGSTQIQPTFEIHARNGAAVIWGRAPNVRDPEDLKAAVAKVERIVQYVKENGPFNNAASGVQLDLRNPLSTIPATARRPDPWQ